MERGDDDRPAGGGHGGNAPDGDRNTPDGDRNTPDGGGNTPGSGGNGPGGGENAPDGGDGTSGGADGGGTPHDGERERPHPSGITTTESTASNEVMVGPPFEGDPESLERFSFGLVPLGSAHRLRITVRNVAQYGARDIDSVDITGPNQSDFAITDNGCPHGTELPPQGVCSVQVTFNPTAEGERLAIMDVITGSCCGNSVELHGATTTEGD